jgi:hypothetical protein
MHILEAIHGECMGRLKRSFLGCTRQASARAAGNIGHLIKGCIAVIRFAWVGRESVRQVSSHQFSKFAKSPAKSTRFFLALEVCVVPFEGTLQQGNKCPSPADW